MNLAEKQKARLKLMNSINSAHKKKVIAPASEVPNTFFLRRPTGVMALDVDAGGGFPAGGVSFISGPDGAGKTMLLYKTFAMHQRLYGNNSFLALGISEFAPDYFFMRKCGVRVAIPPEMIEQIEEERAHRGQPKLTKEEMAELKDQVGVVDIIRGSSGEELLNSVIEMAQTKAYGIIGIDSISSLRPHAWENMEGLEDNPQMAAHATMMTKFFKQFAPLTLGLEDSNETTLICLDQVRSNKKKAEAPSYMQKYLPDYASSQAWATRHGKLVDIMVMSGGKEKAKSGENKGEVIGKTLKWEIVKGKAGTHDGIHGEIDMTYEKLTDDARQVIVQGLAYGVIKEKDGLVTVMQPKTDRFIADKVPGIEKMVEAMEADFELELSVRRAVLTAAGIECSYR